MDVRHVRALATLCQIQDTWGSPKLSITPKMMFRAVILPISLYGCEMWIWTGVQMGRLEMTHSKCLRPLLARS
eukprot:363453-Chlamydomonas_euryale.AAC.6